MSTEFDKEMQKDLDKVVVTSTYTDWVNPEDKQAKKIDEKFRATLVSREEVKNKVAESVDGLPVKDRDLIDGEVEVPTKLLDDASKAEISNAADVSEETVSEPESEPEPESESVSGGVPDGTVREVLEWVDNDTQKAQQALDVENAKGSPRKSLVSQLEDIVGA